MSLYILNTSLKEEAEGQSSLLSCSRYKTNLGIEDNLKMYIIGLEKILKKIKLALVLLDDFNLLQKNSQSREYFNIKKDFHSLILEIKNIIQVFIDLCSHEGDDENVVYLEEQFSCLYIKITLFGLLCQAIYANEAIIIVNITLEIFKKSLEQSNSGISHVAEYNEKKF